MRQNELVALLVSTYKHVQSKVLRLVLKRDFVELLDLLNQNSLEIDDIYLHDGSYWKIKDCLYEEFKGKKKSPLGDLLILSGAGNEVRTRDPNHGKVMLYQLSYSRITLKHAFKILSHRSGARGRGRTGTDG